MTSPIKVEATGATVAVEFKGVTYEIPASRDEMALEVLEHTELGNVALALKALLGDAQYRVFKATKPKVRDVDAMYERIREALGWGN